MEKRWNSERAPDPPLDERNGKAYPTGDLVWMAANLDIGTRINGSLNASDNQEIEKYCYQNSDVNCEHYGGLYSWDEMMQYNYTESPQGICPDGWHIPSYEDWKLLEMELGMTREQADAPDWRGSDQGGKLKATDLWASPNEGATNETGFTALPAGSMDNTGYFSGESLFTDYWASSWEEPNPWYRYLSADRADIYRTRGNRGYGTSVRCVKD
jgi:uncharacterized protein (TIGR02145 family)